ncbi:hypothetical protein DL96DRAFT_372078 [Flagelloscypha sp. PMI_526]|nr:hypothetical protein DL96DRAFT_372078 [Flagelloscypha sp. PMI_526]
MGLLKFLRRLWWKINFRNPLFSYDFPLNGDVLRTISQLLSRRDLVNLRSSCRFAYDALEHDIYLNIELSSMAQCVNGLKFLSTQPNKHHLIKGLDLRPINAPYPPGSSNLPHRLNLIQIIRFEYFVVGKMLHQIIPQLTSLQRFRWDGFRVPPDEIWVLLRQKLYLMIYFIQYMSSIVPLPCSFVPLKDVHCRSWSNFENLSSEIFKFVGLRSFAFFASGIFQPVDDLAVQYTKLPSSLFEMLSQCPKLENLALGGLEFETMRVQLDLNACPILFFHWPQLKNLSLTQVSFHSAQGIGKGIQKTYNNFFNLHEALHTLSPHQSTSPFQA